MKIFKSILKWFSISILLVVILIFLFRNEIVLQIIKMEQSGKEKKPYTMLDLPELNDNLYFTLAQSFDSCAMDPYDYVVEEFKTHDIIFLGENHRIRQDLLFVQQLIPFLYANGIRDLGVELSLNKDSVLIREVITNPEYFDQEKANQIIFNLSPFWGFKEYIDIYRAAWELNRSLPEGAEPFMVHGLMHDLDFSLMTKRSDENNEEVMIKVRKGVEKPEQFMADCIINDLIAKNKKALVFCGMHHAFSGYEGHGNRVGVIVKKAIGDRTMTIALHYPWNGKKGSSHRTVYPVNGSMDAFIRQHKSKEYVFGINVRNTTFGSLIDTTSYYVKKDSMLLSSFCDGYIYLTPFSSMEAVNIQPDFVNPNNVDYARKQLPNPELRDGIFKWVGPKVLNKVAAMDADIKYQYRHLY